MNVLSLDLNLEFQRDAGPNQFGTVIVVTKAAEEIWENDAE